MAAQSRWRAVDVPIDGRSTSRVIRRLPQHDRYSCHGGHQPWKVHRRMVLASCSMVYYGHFTVFLLYYN
ncbi:hypothetical protein SEVIR_7G286508v4 [Setaria viridis]